MAKVSELDIEVLRWPEIRTALRAVNAELADILDAIELTDDCHFYRVGYRYGERICIDGEFCLPDKHRRLIPMSDLPKEVIEDLGYNGATHPAFMVQSKVVDLYVELNDRIVPCVLYGPGDLMGISLIIFKVDTNPSFHTGHPLYEVAAGGRSTLMVPKISQSHRHKLLRRAYDIQTDVPKHYTAHYNTFVDMGQHDDNWRCEIIYFGRRIFEKMHQQKWRDLQLYLLSHLYEKQRFWANQFQWNLAFSRADSKRDMNSPFAVSNFVKHLFALATGRIIGLEPAVNDDVIPYHFIKNAYLEHYKMESAPIIMQPGYLDETPIYASIQFPLLDGTSDVSKLSSGVSYLDDIRYHFENTKRVLIKTDDLNVKWTPIDNIIQGKSFGFYHSFCGKYHNITNSKFLAQDQRFIHTGFEFNGNQPFFNGCIKVALSGK